MEEIPRDKAFSYILHNSSLANVCPSLSQKKKSVLPDVETAHTPSENTNTQYFWACVNNSLQAQL